jgi:hypothetical protein
MAVLPGSARVVTVAVLEGDGTWSIHPSVTPEPDSERLADVRWGVVAFQAQERLL